MLASWRFQLAAVKFVCLGKSEWPTYCIWLVFSTSSDIQTDVSKCEKISTAYIQQSGHWVTSVKRGINSVGGDVCDFYATGEISHTAASLVSFSCRKSVWVLHFKKKEKKKKRI